MFDTRHGLCSQRALLSVNFVQSPHMPSVPVLLTDLMASIIQRRCVMRAGVLPTDCSNGAAWVDSIVWLLCAVSHCAPPAPAPDT
jgi:hypothetical protein